MQKALSTDPKAVYMRSYSKTPRGGMRHSWKNMFDRCCNPANRSYPRYGGRGISVCGEWYDYQSFFDWGCSNGWESGLQIDRIDNSKGYSPDNCRWVTSRKNNRNRDNNKLSEEKVREIRKMLSEKFTGTEIARKYGVHHSLIYRIKLGQQWL